jgi:hypothetical protein
VASEADSLRGELERVQSAAMAEGTRAAAAVAALQSTNAALQARLSATEADCAELRVTNECVNHATGCVGAPHLSACAWMCSFFPKPVRPDLSRVAARSFCGNLDMNDPRFP